MINYTEEIFTRTYKHGDKKLYASFHPEIIVEQEAYVNTGRYFVVLLHPAKGLHSFFLKEDNQTKMWQPDDSDASMVEDELIEWCSYQISTQRERRVEV